MNKSPSFIVTKEHRRFVEFCDACRRYKYIGLCYGSPGIGKTISARQYCQQDDIDELLTNHRLLDLPAKPDMSPCTTLFYTPTVTSSLGRLEKEVIAGRKQLSELNYWMQASGAKQVTHLLPLVVQDVIKLLIVDEADRLKAGGLELLRDIYDRSQLGLILIGMPGIEKRLSRYPQLYSRVGFVHHFKPLSRDEVQFLLQSPWSQLGFDLDLSDFTAAEAMAAILRITNGNFRLLQRLLGQIERVLQINELGCVTKEVVDTARELLIIGSL